MPALHRECDLDVWRVSKHYQVYDGEHVLVRHPDTVRGAGVRPFRGPSLPVGDGSFHTA
jgi:hypothetical protein